MTDKLPPQRIMDDPGALPPPGWIKVPATDTEPERYEPPVGTATEHTIQDPETGEITGRMKL